MTETASRVLYRSSTTASCSRRQARTGTTPDSSSPPPCPALEATFQSSTAGNLASSHGSTYDGCYKVDRIGCNKPTLM